MKVTVKIDKVKEVPFKVVAKTYEEAATFLEKRGSAACYEANPTYKFKHSDGEITEITVHSKPTIAFPKWAQASKLKGEEKKHWDAMIKALHTHEDGHVKIFDTDAKAFKKEQEKAGGFPKGDIGRVMNEFFAACQKNQDAYDKRTNHGIKQGVVLPALK